MIVIFVCCTIGIVLARPRLDWVAHGSAGHGSPQPRDLARLIDARYHRGMAASTKYEPDTMVIYCHEGDEVLARVTEVQPETGEVIGLALYDQDGHITGGVSSPLLATIPQHRITHGYFWRR